MAKPTVDWDPIQLRRRIGYVIQEIGLFPHLTVEENIGVVPRLEGWEPERIQREPMSYCNRSVSTPIALPGVSPRSFPAASANASVSRARWPPIRR